MSATKKGSTKYVQPLDNGATRYRVTIEFSNDYQPAEIPGTDHPSMWDWVGLLDEPDARVLSWTEDENPGYGHPLDRLHRRLCAWQQDECTDADDTIRAWTYMGILSAATALAEQGVPLPQRWMDDLTEAVRELMGDERCDGCAELFVPGECIPCESCGEAFCPKCEGGPCKAEERA